ASWTFRKEAMKPSSSRTLRMASFTCEEGTSTRSCPARIPFRSRVRRSEIESVVFISSPRSLQDARDVSRGGVLTETDSTQRELPEHGPRAAAAAASPDLAGRELRLALRLDSHCSCCHRFLLLVPLEARGTAGSPA